MTTRTCPRCRTQLWNGQHVGGPCIPVEFPWLPKTAAEALALWDAGESVQSVEMGGLGPSYEQAIQIGIFEILRECLPGTWTDADRDAFNALAEKALGRCNEAAGGFSCTQAGAAKGVAWNTLRKGWREALLKLPFDRLIFVRRTFPSAPAGGKA